MKYGIQYNLVALSAKYSFGAFGHPGMLTVLKFMLPEASIQHLVQFLCCIKCYKFINMSLTVMKKIP